MRILHTADLHIGKTVNNFSMLEDQKYVLTQMVDLVKGLNIQAFIIAGDVYDRPVPSAEAVEVFHDFVQQLHETGVEIFCISGNHDSPERLSFAQDILGKHGVHFAGTYKESCRQVTLQDEFGPVVFTLMPFVKPALLGANDSHEAVSRMLTALSDKEKGDKEQEDICVKKVEGEQLRQILITHYFVTNADKEPEVSDSESHVLVGGLDNVDASLFKRFHYTALGHIHKPQRMDREDDVLHPVIYAGSPLAYSFSECAQEKSLVFVELSADGVATIERQKLEPLRRMRKLKGKLEELIRPEVSEQFDREDYLQVTLTDVDELIDPIGTLRNVYPNVMQLLFEKKEKEAPGDFAVTESLDIKTTEELFEDFYRLLREEDMDEERKNVVQDIVKELE